MGGATTNDVPSEATENEAGALGSLGAAAIELLAGGRELYSLFVRTLFYTVRGRREPGAIAAQMFEIGNRSVFFLTVTMATLNTILVYQAGLQIQRTIPDYSMAGAFFNELLIRDFAPSLGALMIGTRVGAGIAAEIGSMVVTEQVDALRMCAADPVDFLIVPRFVASVVMTVVLVVWGAFVAELAGSATARLAFDVAPHTFMNFTRVDIGDITVGFVKCVSYGAAIPIVSGYCGLSTLGGSEGVGWATTRAVVNSSVTIIVLDALISVVGFIVFPG